MDDGRKGGRGSRGAGSGPAAKATPLSLLGTGEGRDKAREGGGRGESGEDGREGGKVGEGQGREKERGEGGREGGSGREEGGGKDGER